MISLISDMKNEEYVKNPTQNLPVVLFNLLIIYTELQQVGDIIASYFYKDIFVFKAIKS